MRFSVMSTHDISKASALGLSHAVRLSHDMPALAMTSLKRCALAEP